MTKANEQLDLRGEMCPYPLDQTKVAVRALSPGAAVEVLVDCPESVGNLTRWVGNAGHAVVETRTLGPAEWSLVLEKA